MKLLATAALAVAALSHCASATWTITPSNATQPEEVQGPHQTYIKVWTVSGSQPLTAVKFSAAGLVFIDYDTKLNAAPTEAPTEAPVATTDAPTDSPVVTTDVPTDAPTEAPVTEAPATEAPVTDAPVTEAPTTEAPVTEAPVTEAPTTEAPVTEAPVTAAPTTEAPTTEAPTEAPATAGSGVGLPPGVVSLNEVASTVLAKVVFSGNCTKLLDELEVVEHDGALKIHFKNADFSGYGYILTQIYVGEKEVLSEVINAGSSSIFISENVVTASNSSAEVYIKTDGDGDIFVTASSTAFTLKSFSTKISGAGNIQFSADSLTLGDSLESRVSGDGDIAIVAKKVDANNTISSKISGAGNIFVQADNVTTFKVKSKITGEGAITVSTNGSCVKQDISVSGSGLIATGSIASVDTTIRMSGEGSVLVQTSHKLLVPHSIYSGSVQYVGTAPQEITDGTKPRPITKKPKHPRHPRHHHFWFSWGDEDEDEDEDSDEDHDHDYEDDEHHLPKSVTQATENKYDTYTLRDAAPRESTFLVLELRQNWWGDEPNARIVISIFGVDIGGSLVANTQAMAVRVQKQHPVVRGLFFMGFVAVALSAVVITFHKVVIGQRRREYQPLMQVVTSNKLETVSVQAEQMM